MTEGYHTRYRRLYSVLKRFGFSGAKAIEILIDAQRGDKHARSVLTICRDRFRRGRTRHRLSFRVRVAPL